MPWSRLTYSKAFRRAQGRCLGENELGKEATETDNITLDLLHKEDLVKVQ